MQRASDELGYLPIDKFDAACRELERDGISFASPALPRTLTLTDDELPAVAADPRAHPGS